MKLKKVLLKKNYSVFCCILKKKNILIGVFRSDPLWPFIFGGHMHLETIVLRKNAEKHGKGKFLEIFRKIGTEKNSRQKTSNRLFWLRVFPMVTNFYFSVYLQSFFSSHLIKNSKLNFLTDRE